MTGGVVHRYRSFDRPVQLLLLNQFTINVAFYMLMPYLANHLTDGLGLAVWVTGLVLGVRNLTQQGMFLIGGALADRRGFKPPIVAGCALRTAGFALLGFADSVPALILASAATGFAGALFNPAVRAYLAQDAGERRVDAFALFNVFYQAGILIGPLVGLVLTGIAFRLAAAFAALLFGALAVLQARALPPRRATPNDMPAISSRHDWRAVVANRTFLLFVAVMASAYVLTFQIYLVLPLTMRRHIPSETGATIAVAALFVVSGFCTIAGQLRITAWCKCHWGTARSLSMALGLMAMAFLLPAFAASLPPTASTSASTCG